MHKAAQKSENMGSSQVLRMSRHKIVQQEVFYNYKTQQNIFKHGLGYVHTKITLKSSSPNTTLCSNNYVHFTTHSIIES